MNFFRKLNKKQRRQFDKLKKEEKDQIISKEINDKVREKLNQEVAIAFADGFLFANNMIYEKYFDRWSKAKYNDKHKIAKEMIEEIEKNREKYLERHNLNKDEKSEGENK